MLWTRSCVSNKLCHDLFQRSRSNLPYGMTHSIGSCASAFGGHGQTVSGWNSDTRASASRTFHAAVSALTIDKISVSAVLMWKVSGICIADQYCMESVESSQRH